MPMGNKFVMLSNLIIYVSYAGALAIIVRNILGHRFNWQLQSALLAIRQTVQNGGYFRAPDQKFSSLRQTFPRPYFF